MACRPGARLAPLAVLAGVLLGATAGVAAAAPTPAAPPYVWSPGLAPVVLGSGWTFYWQEFLPPARQTDAGIAALPGPARPIQPIARWQDPVGGQPALPLAGYGTFVLKVPIPADRASWAAARPALEIGKISSSARIWWDGRLLAAYGEPGKDAASTRARMGMGIFPLDLPVDPAAGGAWLVVEVANYDDNYPGMQIPPRIGALADLQREHSLSLVLAFAMVGVFVIMAVYHLFLFLFRPDERAPLYFSIICILLCLRILSTDRLPLAEIWPEVPVWLLWQLSYQTFALLVGAFCFFTTNLFRFAFSPVVRWGGAGVALLYSLVILVTPPSFYTLFMVPFQVVCLVVGLLLIALVVVALAGRREHAALFGSGLLTVFAATVYDIVKTNLNLPWPSLVPAGMLAFVFILALVLTRKSSQLLTTTERLNHRLQRINHAMARFVPRDLLRISPQPSITETDNSLRWVDDFGLLAIRFAPGAGGAASLPASFQERLTLLIPLVRSLGGAILGAAPDGISCVFAGSANAGLDSAIRIKKALSASGAACALGYHHGPVCMATLGDDHQLLPLAFPEAGAVAEALAHHGLTHGVGLSLAAPTVRALVRPENFQFRVYGVLPPSAPGAGQFAAEFFDGEAEDHWRAKRRTRKGFEYAVHLALEGRDAEAAAAFDAHLRDYPGDAAARRHREKITARTSPGG